MPWNGSGGFTRNNGVDSGATVWTAAESAQRTINGLEHDTHDEDLADGLENCLTRDGQNSPTADIAFGSNKITGLADGTADTDAVTVGQMNTRLAAPVAFEPVTWTSPLAWNAGTTPRGTLAVTGDIAGVDLTGTVDGGIYVLRIRQDATGGRTIAWPAGWLWPDSGEVPALSPGADAVDILTLLRVDTAICAALLPDLRAAP